MSYILETEWFEPGATQCRAAVVEDQHSACYFPGCGGTIVLPALRNPPRPLQQNAEQDGSGRQWILVRSVLSNFLWTSAFCDGCLYAIALSGNLFSALSDCSIGHNCNQCVIPGKASNLSIWMLHPGFFFFTVILPIFHLKMTVGMIASHLW